MIVGGGLETHDDKLSLELEKITVVGHKECPFELSRKVYITMKQHIQPL